MTTLALSHRTVNHKLKSAVFPRVSYKSFYLLATVILACMLVLYIVNINQLTKGTYLIKSYNKDVNVLMEESRILQARFAESDFLGAVQERAHALSFEKTSNITYVQILESPLGMKY